MSARKNYFLPYIFYKDLHITVSFYIYVFFKNIIYVYDSFFVPTEARRGLVFSGIGIMIDGEPSCGFQGLTFRVLEMSLIMELVIFETNSYLL